jgi:inner membrane protein
MPTPIGHAIAGLVVNKLTRKSTVDLSEAALCIFMANAPDLDWIPGILTGRPALYHQGISHSFGISILGSLLVAAAFHLTGRSFKRAFLIGLLAYSSHLLLDFFGLDSREPIGIPLLWPLLDQTFNSPIALFLNVQHVPSDQSTVQDLINGLLSWHNLLTIVVEVAVVGPFLLLANRFSRPKKMMVTKKSISGEIP